MKADDSSARSLVSEAALPRFNHLAGMQSPEQSAPPFDGSQLSVGSSKHVVAAAHVIPANPPQLFVIFLSRQIPVQSAPPFFGSQVSRGSSMQVADPLHLIPANPPHVATLVTVVVVVDGTHSPLQSRPPLAGSQLSRGSSTQAVPFAHASPANPPHILALDAVTQMPLQSAPPLAGSQLSRASSTHVLPLAHARPAIPPHVLACVRSSVDESSLTASVDPHATAHARENAARTWIVENEKRMRIVTPESQ